MHIPCYIAGKAIYLPSYMAFCYIAHNLCYIAHAYTMLYSVLGYIAALIYSILLYSTYFILYSTCTYQVLYSTRLYGTLISYIAMLIAASKLYSTRASYIAWPKVPDVVTKNRRQTRRPSPSRTRQPGIRLASRSKRLPLSVRTT